MCATATAAGAWIYSDQEFGRSRRIVAETTPIPRGPSNPRSSTERSTDTVVSLITEGSSTDDQGRRFPRRRLLPAVALLSVLALLGHHGVGSHPHRTRGVRATTVDCNPPVKPKSPDAPTPVPLGEKVGRSTLLDVAPAALSSTQVRVFNASGERGQAAHVAAQLGRVRIRQRPRRAGRQRSGVRGSDTAVLRPDPLRRAGLGRRQCTVARRAVRRTDPGRPHRRDRRSGTGHLLEGHRPSADADEFLKSLKDPVAGAEPAPLDSALLDAARTARC